MKNILKYILCCAFCVGVILTTTTTVNAEDKPIAYATEDINQGETYYYYMKWSSGSEYQYQLANNLTYTGSGKMALYLGDTTKYPMWIREASTSMSIPSYRSYKSFETCESYGSWSIGNATSMTNLVLVELKTNIPIFASQDLANQYRSGSIGIEKALNYKKISQDGAWVRPFEDIEINDSDILVPTLTNISHQGFSVTNNNDDRYLIQVYVDSGIQDVRDYLSGKTTISNSLYTNSFGLISDNTEANYAGPNINILDCYGCDNKTELMNDLIDFYSKYPNSWTYEKEFDYDYGVFKSTSPCTFDIWGRYFGKTYAFWNNASKVDSSSVDMSCVDEIPIVYTHYRVRYFYYDDDSGFHYGPWSNVVYFSGGRVSQSGIFQDNNGNIIETGADTGLQDQNGNISFAQSNWIDLQDTNSLFGYLRSLINNINATGNNFMTLFGTVFSFLPSDLLAIIWLGIGCIILVGIIRAFN